MRIFLVLPKFRFASQSGFLLFFGFYFYYPQNRVFSNSNKSVIMPWPWSWRNALTICWMVFWSDALDRPSVLNAYYVLPASAFHKHRRLWLMSMKLGEHMPHSMLTVHVTRPQSWRESYGCLSVWRELLNFWTTLTKWRQWSWIKRPLRAGNVLANCHPFSSWYDSCFINFKFVHH